MNTRDKDFQLLQDKWYAKLKKSGFEDAEKDEQSLKQYSSGLMGTQRESYSVRKVYYDSVQDYYIMAEHFLNEHKFKSNERTIWSLHSQGISARDIALSTKSSKSVVSRKICQLRHQMFDLYKVKI